MVDSSFPSQRNIAEERLDTSSHLLYSCPAFWKMRMNKNFEDDHDLCEFYKSVIDYRMENDED